MYPSQWDIRDIRNEIHKKEEDIEATKSQLEGLLKEKKKHAPAKRDETETEQSASNQITDEEAPVVVDEEPASETERNIEEKTSELAQKNTELETEKSKLQEAEVSLGNMKPGWSIDIVISVEVELQKATKLTERHVDDELTQPQRDAAKKLGYSVTSWMSWSTLKGIEWSGESG